MTKKSASHAADSTAKPKVMHMCTVCSYTTQHKGYLTRHMRTHTSRQANVCVYCL